MMNRIIRLISVLALSIAAAACQKELEPFAEHYEDGTEVELLVSDEVEGADDIKSSYSAGKGVSLSGTENIALYYTPAGASAMTVAKSIIAKAASKGNYSFTVPAGVSKATWIPVLPYSSSLVGQNSKGTGLTLRLGPVQYPLANSFDPQSDVLLGLPFDLDVAAGQRSASIVRFKRMFAPLRIKVKGLPAGEKIYAFSVVSDEAPTKYNSMNGLYYLTPSKDFDAASISNGQTGSLGNSMSALYKDGLADIGGEWPVWLVVNPSTLKSGGKLTFTVTTETKTYTRTVQLTRNMTFERGRLNNLSVNITGSGVETRSSRTYFFIGSTTCGWKTQNSSFYNEADSSLPDGVLRFVNAGGSFTFPDTEDIIHGARIYSHPSNRGKADLDVSFTLDGTDKYTYNLVTSSETDNLAYKAGVVEMVPPKGKSSLAGLTAVVGSNQVHMISAITLYTSPDPNYTPTEEDLSVDQTLFSMLDWTYKPLSQIKTLYDQRRYKQASAEVLKYFKTRTGVVNPEVSPVTASDAQYIVDLALNSMKENGYRFCVHNGNYYESKNGSTYVYYSFSDGKGGINWELEIPSVGTEFYQKHWHAWFDYFARMYDFSKDEKYFNAWKEQYSDWLSKYPCPSKGTVKYNDSKPGSYGYKSWCELSMATRIANQTKLFEYFKGAEGFDYAWLTTFLVAFDECVEYSMKNLYYTENSNIRFSQYKSHCLAGILFPELKHASNWLNTGAKQVSGAFKISFLDDGCLEELDFGYHTGEIENYRLAFNAARANGRLDKFSTDYLSNLYNACKFVVDYIYPFYQNEVFNETKESTKNVILRWCRQYSEMFPSDNKMLYLGSDRTKGAKPTETLSLYKTSGYYMFHAGWLPESMMLIYKNNYNPNNMWHSHLDNGTVSICNKGRMFLPAPGSYTYGDGTGGDLDKERAEFKAAKNHNTITLGLADIPKTNSKGKYLTSYTKDGVDCVVAENQSYSGLTHRRAVWMVNGEFFVIADACYGSASGTLNFNWHMLRDASLGVNCVSYDDDKSHNAYGAHTVFTDGNNMAFKTFADTSAGFAVETGLSSTSPKLGERYQRRYYRINVTKGASATPRFVTVLCPCTGTSGVSVSASFPNSFSSTGETVKVIIDNKEYTLSYTL